MDAAAVMSYTDTVLASHLKDWSDNNKGRRILIIATNYTAVLVGLDSSVNAIGRGDFGPKCGQLANILIKEKRLFIYKIYHLPKLINIARILTIATRANKGDLIGLVGNKSKGRTGDLSLATAKRVWIEARGCCQFEGCGEDLSRHFVMVRNGYYGYLAHIVAASPDGPRGDVVSSCKLVDDPSNIMLLCDKCHRLIDKIAPYDYSPSLLRQMRATNIATTNRLLSTLRFPAVLPIIIGNNITGQNAMFDSSKITNALIDAGLRPVEEAKRFFYTLGNINQTSDPNDWWCALRDVPTEVARLRALLSGHGEVASSPERVAIFALSNMTTLILIGRLLGEGRTVHFSHRENRGQWSWLNTKRPTPQHFKYEILNNKTRPKQREAVLLLHITAKPSFELLPLNIYQGGRFRHPTIRITAAHAGTNSISSLAELDNCALVIEQAIRKLVDDWQIARIHVIPIAPVTACLRFGQKMQARHHPSICIYERDKGVNNNSQMKPTLEINTKTASICGRDIKVPIQ